MKLKFVLPSLGITSCALAIAPFATSCSKSDTFQLKISERFADAYVSRLYSFKLNKSYKFIAHINKLPSVASLSWSFRFTYMDEDSNHYMGDINKNNFSIKINSAHLHEGVDYTFAAVEGYNYVKSIKEDSIKVGDTITIECSLTKKMINSLWAGFLTGK